MKALCYIVPFSLDEAKQAIDNWPDSITVVVDKSKSESKSNLEPHKIIPQVMSLLGPFNKSDQRRVMDTVNTYLSWPEQLTLVGDKPKLLLKSIKPYEVIPRLISLLFPLSRFDQKRIINAVSAYFGFD